MGTILGKGFGFCAAQGRRWFDSAFRNKRPFFYGGRFSFLTGPFAKKKGGSLKYWIDNALPGNIVRREKQRPRLEKFDYGPFPRRRGSGKIPTFVFCEDIKKQR